MDISRKELITIISRFIALVLRHKPEEIGITLDEHGWANVDELVRGVEARYPGFNTSHLEEIVQTDEKQRYSFNEDKTLIRANQGHSIPVDVDLDILEPPEYLFHGTAFKYMVSIEQLGLIPKSRLYVHLSGNVTTAMDVGKRHGVGIVLRVRSGDMYRDGFTFYRSVNGVWLTKSVPIEYLEQYIDEKSVLWWL